MTVASPVPASPVPTPATRPLSLDWRSGFNDATDDVITFLPKALLFVVILVVGFVLARVARTVVDRILERVGFDSWVERGGIRAALARSRYDASDIVAKLVYYAILLFTLQLAFGVWGPNPVSDLIAAVVAWLPHAFVAVIILVVAAAIAAAVKDVIVNALGGLSYGKLLANAASIFIIGLGVVAALNQIGVATTVTTPVLIAVLATIAGILIVGVGGGLVKPMQSRWESWLDRAAAESQTIAEHAKAYSDSRREREAALARPATGAAPAPNRTEPVFATGHAPAAPPPAMPAPPPAAPLSATPPPAAPAAPPPAAPAAPPAAKPAGRTGPDTGPATTTPDNERVDWPLSESPTQVIPPSPREPDA